MVSPLPTLRNMTLVVWYILQSFIAMFTVSLLESTMVYRVVSTKLTEEEHSKLLDVCNTEGCSPSALMKQAIMEKIEPETVNKSKNPKEMSLKELLERLRSQKKS